MKKFLLAVTTAVLVIALSGAGYAVSEYVTTQINFNIPSILAFTVTLPALTAVESSNTTATAATSAIEFNSTGATDSNVEPCVVGGSCQSIANDTPIFVYDNTGTVILANITVKLDTALPACITLKGNNSASCVGTTISTSDVVVASSFGPNDADVNYYLCADFSSCTTNDTTTKTLTHTGTE